MRMVWLFNIVGLLDLIYANISTFKDHVDSTYLGVSYYLAAVNVPDGGCPRPDLRLLAEAWCYMVQDSAGGEVR